MLPENHPMAGMAKVSLKALAREKFVFCQTAAVSIIGVLPAKGLKTMPGCSAMEADSVTIEMLPLPATNSIVAAAEEDS